MCHLLATNGFRDGGVSLIETALLGGYLFFKDMADAGDLNLADPLQKECLWFSFAKVLQVGFDEVKDNWNTHYIRKSRFETVSGRPDSLYTIPEFHGRVDGLIVPVQSGSQ